MMKLADEVFLETGHGSLSMIYYDNGAWWRPGKNFSPRCVFINPFWFQKPVLELPKYKAYKG